MPWQGLRCGGWAGSGTGGEQANDSAMNVSSESFRSLLRGELRCEQQKAQENVAKVGVSGEKEKGFGEKVNFMAKKRMCLAKKTPKCNICGEKEKNYLLSPPSSQISQPS